MQENGIKVIHLPDRDIKIEPARRLQNSLKNLKKILGEEEAQKVWSQFPVRVNDTVAIPTPDVEPT
jgi:hypothetical protein